MKKIVVAVLLLATALTGGARVAESPAECAARYGQPVKPLAVNSSGEAHGEYLKDGVQVQITFANDRAVALKFSKPGGNPLTPEQIGVLLTANASDSFWHETGSKGAGEFRNRSYTRSDGNALAEVFLSPKTATLFIQDATFKQSQRAQSAKLEGF